MAKQLAFEHEAREHLRNGIAKLAKAANRTEEEFRREFEGVVAFEPPPLVLDTPDEITAGSE